jgi:hypothetical protein
MRHCVFLAMVVCASAFAQEAPRERVGALLDRGNGALARAMEQGVSPDAQRAALREASASYGTVLDAGLDGPAIRMNLAAVEAQLGARGYAALHLRAAGRSAMDRGDEAAIRAADAAFASLRAGAGDAWPPASDAIMAREARWALGAAHGAGATNLIVASMACWSLAWLLLGMRVARVDVRAPALAITLAFVAAVVPGVVVVGASWADAQASSIGVVVREGVAGRVGPGDAFDSIAVSSAEGADVRVLDERDDWLKVRTSGGAEAWLPRDAIAFVTRR